MIWRIPGIIKKNRAKKSCGIASVCAADHLRIDFHSYTTDPTAVEQKPETRHCKIISARSKQYWLLAHAESWRFCIGRLVAAAAEAFPVVKDRWRGRLQLSLLQRGSDHLRRAAITDRVTHKAASVDIRNERLEEKRASASTKSSGVLEFKFILKKTTKRP